NLITRIIEYFVQNQSLDSTKIDGLPDSVDRLTIDYLSFEYNELSNVWSAIGTKLLPFAAYKIGFIPIQPTASLGNKIERISGMGTNLDQK
ncbi:MAG: Pvc16 N-terminal domain, partial [Bacteroidota bacterium]